MFKFQNCAPAVSSDVTPTAGVVGVVDNFANTPLAFVANPQLVEPSAGAVDVQGLCVGGPDHQTIEYQVYTVGDSPQMVANGQAPCEGGEFLLSLSQLSFSSCADQYQVYAVREGQSGPATVTTLQSQCD